MSYLMRCGIMTFFVIATLTVGLIFGQSIYAAGSGSSSKPIGAVPCCPIKKPSGLDSASGTKMLKLVRYHPSQIMLLKII